MPPEFQGVCIRVVHTAWQGFLSYLDFLLWWNGAELVDYIEVTVLGANDDEPMHLTFDPAQVAFASRLGLHAPGDKDLVAVVVHFKDGSTLDITDWVAADIGDVTFAVRYPQEDEFGDCPG